MMHSINFLLIFHLLITSVYANINNNNNATKEVDDIFDAIERDHAKLRQLFESVLGKQEVGQTGKSWGSNGTSDCVCVPVHLCNEAGFINSDGEYLLKPRLNTEDTLLPICPDPTEICCHQQPKEDPLPSSTCGFGSRNNDVRKDPSTSLFGEFPWTVMVLENTVNYVCSGSLIHPQVVLTAGHCVNATGNYTLRVGEWDVSGKKEPLPHQSQYVQAIIVHPQYNSANLHYDVALLTVEQPFKLAENVRIGCIGDYAPYNLKASYDKCIATGWGYDQLTDMYKRIMKKIQFSLVHHRQCQERLRTTTHLGKWFELHPSFICASGQNGVDVCTGDGGGPLACVIPGTANRYQLVGVTSWGVGCAEKTPSVFARVSAIKHWIDGWFEVFGFSKDFEFESVRLIY